MSSGFFANRAWVITPAEVKQLCPKEFAQLEKVLAASDLSLENLAEAAHNGETFAGRPARALRSLARAFERLTRVRGHGLTIALDYHSADNGQCYDSLEVYGAYFAVGGVETLTPAGIKFQDHLTEAFWVDFG